MSTSCVPRSAQSGLSVSSPCQLSIQLRQTRRGRKIVERVIQRGSSDGDEKSWSESFERCAISIWSITMLRSMVNDALLILKTIFASMSDGQVRRRDRSSPWRWMAAASPPHLMKNDARYLRRAFSFFVGVFYANATHRWRM